MLRLAEVRRVKSRVGASVASSPLGLRSSARVPTVE
jgi:hypothetical protein